MAKRLQILVMNGELAGKRLDIPERGLRLGRSRSNDVHFLDEELSRNHCLFEKNGENGIRVVDLASANGTFVNSIQLGADAKALTCGDIIEIGSTVFKVVEEGSQEPPPNAPEPAQGGSQTTTVHDPLKRVDLGLGGESSKDQEVQKTPQGKADAKRAALANILWGVAAALAILTIALVLMLPEIAETPAASESEAARNSATSNLEAFSYEYVDGDSSHIYRMEITLDRQHILRVVAVDVPSGDRFIDESAKLSPEDIAALDSIFADQGWLALDSLYSGNPVSAENALKSYRISVQSGNDPRDVLVENRDEPEPFRNVRERLWAFASAKLPIDDIQYTREQLIELSSRSEMLGDAKWSERDAAWGNISEAIDFYRKAEFRLKTVNPKPPQYELLREKRKTAEEELEKRYRQYRENANIAKGTRKWDEAIGALNIIREIIPDRSDSRHSEAEAEIKAIETNRK